jgi:hypothetical protein
MNCPNCRDTGLFPLVVAAIGDRLPRAICPCPAGDRVAVMLAPASGAPRAPAGDHVHLANSHGSLAPVLRCGRRPTAVAGYVGDLRTDEFKIVGPGPQIALRDDGQPLCPECVNAMPPCCRCDRPWHAHVEGLPGLCREGYAPTAVESRPPPPTRVHLLRGEIAGTVCGAAWTREGIDRGEIIGIYRVDAWVRVTGLGLHTKDTRRGVCPQCANRAPDCADCGRPWIAHAAEALKCYKPGDKSLWTKGDPEQIAGRMPRSEPHQIVWPSQEQEDAQRRLRGTARQISALKNIGNPMEEFRAEQALHAAAFSFVKTQEKAFTGTPGPTDAQFADALDAYVATLGHTEAMEEKRQARREVFRLWDQRHLPHFQSRGMRWFLPALRKALGLDPIRGGDLMTVLKNVEALTVAATTAVAAVQPAASPPMGLWEGRRCHVCADGIFKRFAGRGTLVCCSACGATPPSREPRANEPRALVRHPDGRYVPAPPGEGA